MENTMLDETKIEIYEHLLDGTNQLIQISDLESCKMIYANKAARSFTNHASADYRGHFCYKYMMGLDVQCPFCPMLFMPEGQASYETEVDNGVQVFSVRTERFELNGRPVFAEFASDITIIKRAQQLYESQMNNIFSSVQEAQGIFYMNLTRNTVESVNGVSAEVNKLKNDTSADMLLTNIGNYVPDEDYRERFHRLYSRDSLLKMQQEGKTELVMEARSYFEDGSIRWAKLTAKILTNPVSNDVECIFYGMDINDIKTYREKVHQAEHEKMQIQEAAKYDRLTGVYGKSAFMELLQEHSQTENVPSYAVAFIDLDNFKQVNDVLGHLMGDQVIIETARKLQGIFRSGDVIARFGGDEFCVLIKDISLENLKRKLQYTLEQLRATYRDESNTAEAGKTVEAPKSVEAAKTVGLPASVEVSASIGVLYCDHISMDAMEIIQIADDALYRAKRSGKNQFYIA